MMEFVDDHTVRLVPNAPKKRRPYKQLNAVEQVVFDSLKNAMVKEIRGQRFLQRQLAVSDRYQAALVSRSWRKCSGLPGFVSGPEGCKVMRRTG